MIGYQTYWEHVYLFLDLLEATSTENKSNSANTLGVRREKVLNVSLSLSFFF